MLYTVILFHSVHHKYIFITSRPPDQTEFIQDAISMRHNKHCLVLGCEDQIHLVKCCSLAEKSNLSLASPLCSSAPLLKCVQMYDCKVMSTCTLFILTCLGYDQQIRCSMSHGCI